MFGSHRLVGVSPSRYLTVLVQRRLRDQKYVLLPHEFAAELATAEATVEAGSAAGSA